MNNSSSRNSKPKSRRAAGKPTGPPTRRPENALARRLGGNAIVAGVDEAGRGPLAGPVVAAAVIWPARRPAPKGLNDSKQVKAAERERMFREIVEKADAVGVGVATAREIDGVNILRATRLAARRALDALPVAPDGVVTDFLTLPGYPAPIEPLVGGDCLSVNIAAASIVAKVIRDRMMDHYAEEYPGFGWESNRGYGTTAHLEALARLGPTTLHRLTFAGVGFFVERLRPSRTFCGIRESRLRESFSPETPPGPVASPGPRFGRGWRLRPRNDEGLVPTDLFDPCVAALAAPEWPGTLPAPIRLLLLDEREIEALEFNGPDPEWLLGPESR